MKGGEHFKEFVISNRICIVNEDSQLMTFESEAQQRKLTIADNKMANTK